MEDKNLTELFAQIKNEGKHLLENLMSFALSINNMNNDQLVAFYQGLDLFLESQPKGTIFNRTYQYKMIKKVQKIAENKMLHVAKSTQDGNYIKLLEHFDKATRKVRERYPYE